MIKQKVCNNNGTIDLHLACLCRVGAMDVMAVSSQSCLDLSTELESQQQIQVRG